MLVYTLICILFLVAIIAAQYWNNKILLKQIHGSQQQDVQSLMHNMQTSVLDQLHNFKFDISKNIDNSLNDQITKLHTQIDTKLGNGLEKTSSTVIDIIKRLALIDEAQKRLTSLSENVVSLQEILTDKRSRGAFGEVQLKNLIINIIPQQHVSFQHTLSNGARCDCLLILPQPTGNLVIDAKFPLENYQKATTFNIPQQERNVAGQLFKQNIKKHIQDIASKYIIPEETADGAIMFIPAESVFAEIHQTYPELVEFAHQNRIWLASPSTMMAILTTTCSVIKDVATREHIHTMQQHLKLLAKDFERFELRMQKLTKHIEQSQEDVQQVNLSAKKISQRFTQIEQVELKQVEMQSE